MSRGGPTSWLVGKWQIDGDASERALRETSEKDQQETQTIEASE